MREKLEEIKKNALDVLQKATDIDALEEARIKFLGKKGEDVYKRQGKSR